MTASLFQINFMIFNLRTEYILSWRKNGWPVKYATSQFTYRTSTCWSLLSVPIVFGSNRKAYHFHRAFHKRARTGLLQTGNSHPPLTRSSPSRCLSRCSCVVAIDTARLSLHILEKFKLGSIQDGFRKVFAMFKIIFFCFRWRNVESEDAARGARQRRSTVTSGRPGAVWPFAGIYFLFDLKLILF